VDVPEAPLHTERSLQLVYSGPSATPTHPFMFATQNRYHILALSEDRALIRGIEAGISEHLDEEIYCTADILHLLEAHASHTSRLILIDVDLLHEGLPSLISVMRSIDRACRVLLLLSGEDLSWCTAVLPFGNISFVMKPVDVPAIQALVRSHLRIPETPIRSSSSK